MSVTTPLSPQMRAAVCAGGRHASLAIMLADIVALICALILSGAVANAIREIVQIEAFSSSSQKYAHHAILSLALGAVLIIWLYARRHYSTRQTLSNQTKDILLGCFSALLAAAFFNFSVKADMARLTTFLTWGFVAGLMIFGRLIAMKALIARNAWFTPVLLLGPEDRGAHFTRITRAHPELGFKIASTLEVGSVLQLLNGRSDEQIRSMLSDALSRARAKTLLIAPGKDDYSAALDLIEQLQRLRIHFVFAPETGVLAVENVMIQQLAPFDGVMLTPLDNLDRPAARALKCMSEQTAAAVALVILAPIFLVLCAIIMSDGGSPFFAQKRIGRNGRPFSCLKFRSMTRDAEERLARLLRDDATAAEEWRRNQKLMNDPRITPIGRFLRATSLDELPQLINVMIGDMSIVGPRPVVPAEIKRYGEYAHYYYRVRPGITGLWQVNGRNETSYEERVRLDAYYVRNWTLWRDLCIACKTIPEMLWKRSGV